jgi:ribosomal protein S18 acetylase RimI-like enzyme
MVQTSIAAWLKKATLKNDEKTRTVRDIAESNIVETAPLDEPILTDEQTDIIFKEEKAHNEKFMSLDRDRKLRLPAQASLARITAETLPSFRRMTSILLPVPYPDKFYNETIHDKVTNSISMVALWSDTSTPSAVRPRVVSGIRCRLLAKSPGGQTQGPSLYISTITTLAPFRGHGLASALLRYVTARAIEDYSITTVTAHMWEANEEARQWYVSLGFQEITFDPVYYHKIKPTGAYLLERTVGPRDLLFCDELKNG